MHKTILRSTLKQIHLTLRLLSPSSRQIRIGFHLERFNIRLVLLINLFQGQEDSVPFHFLVFYYLVEAGPHELGLEFLRVQHFGDIVLYLSVVEDLIETVAELRVKLEKLTEEKFEFNRKLSRRNVLMIS